MINKYKILCHHCNTTQTTTYKILKEIPTVIKCECCEKEISGIRNTYVNFSDINYESLSEEEQSKLKRVFGIG